LVHKVGGTLDEHYIIEMYNMAFIKLNSLEACHKTQELEKLEKRKELSEQESQMAKFLMEEEKLNAFLDTLHLDEDIRANNPRSLEGMKMQAEQISIKMKQREKILKDCEG
jgi:hypothetical protein